MSIPVLMPKVASRAMPAKVPRSNTVATAPSAARRPAPEAWVATDGCVATELTGATTVAAAAANTAAEETPMVSTAGATEEGTNLGLSAEAQIIVPNEAAPEEDVVGAGSSLLVRGELPETGELPDQPAVTGWDIVVSGSALAASHPNSILLARAYHTIDRLGGILAAGLADLEDEHRHLATERTVHEAESRRLAVSWREVQGHAR